MVTVRPDPGSGGHGGRGGQALPDPPLCAAAASHRATEASPPQNNSGSRYHSPAGLRLHSHNGLLPLRGRGREMIWSPLLGGAREGERGPLG